MTLDFERDCLGTGKLRAIGLLSERAAEAEKWRDLAGKRLAAARLLVGTEGEQMAVGQAALAMECKANELLALRGFSSRSHVCTQMALARVLRRDDLAARLSRAYQDRMAFDYTSDPRAMASAASVPAFVREAARFLDEVETDLRPPS